jgi:hypothetical protein
MNKRTLTKIAAGVLVLALSLQGGATLYSYAKEATVAADQAQSAVAAATSESAPAPSVQAGQEQAFSEQQTIALQEATAAQETIAVQEAIAEREVIAEQQAIAAAAASIRLSDEVLQAIRLSEPQAYERNSGNYTYFLAEFNVHEEYRAKLDAMLLSGSRLPDVLTAYDYVYRQFGSFADVERLLAARQSGRTWTELFAAYQRDAQPFVPQAFDSDYLEELMNSPELTADDIMIADQISFKTGTPVAELITAKLEGTDSGWRESCAVAGLLFSGESLPRVTVTGEQLKKHAQAAVMSEEQVVEAFVLANKLGQQGEAVITKLKQGSTEASLYEEAYAGKYGASTPREEAQS